MAHLPTLLRKGLDERPDPDIASQMRQKYKVIENTKRKAAAELKSINPELAAELEELATELDETHEKFVQLAGTYDAWHRPDPELPNQLRQKEEERKKDLADPNYEAHVKGFMSKGRSEDRPDPDLPSSLRLMRYKYKASVKKLAAEELSKVNPALAEELQDMAVEMEESHEQFEKMVETMKGKRDDRPSPNLPSELRTAKRAADSLLD